MPGDNVDMEVELITPIAMEKGLRFAIREGGRTVGAGVVAEIVGCSREAHDARSSHARLQRLQATQLHHEEEQAPAPGPRGVQEVLPVLPQAHGSQRDAVGRGRRRSFERRPDRSQACSSVWLEHRSPKPGVGGSNPSRPASPGGGTPGSRRQENSSEWRGWNESGSSSRTSGSRSTQGQLADAHTSCRDSTRRRDRHGADRDGVRRRRGSDPAPRRRAAVPMMKPDGERCRARTANRRELEHGTRSGT